MPEDFGPSPLRAMYRGWRIGNLMKKFLAEFMAKNAPEPRGQVMAKITDSQITARLGMPASIEYDDENGKFDIVFSQGGKQYRAGQFSVSSMRGMTDSEALAWMEGRVADFLLGQPVACGPEQLLKADQLTFAGIFKDLSKDYVFDDGTPATNPVAMSIDPAVREQIKRSDDMAMKRKLQELGASITREAGLACADKTSAVYCLQELAAGNAKPIMDAMQEAGLVMDKHEFMPLKKDGEPSSNVIRIQLHQK